MGFPPVFSIKDTLSTYGLTPQLLEPCRIGGSVSNGVLNVPVAEIILNEPGVGSLVGESEAAGMA